jgi:hypothetical protein
MPKIGDPKGRPATALVATLGSVLGKPVRPAAISCPLNTAQYQYLSGFQLEKY